MCLLKECFFICFQTDQLVEQQIVISRLRSDLMMFRTSNSGVTVETEAAKFLTKRPHSVPPIRHSTVKGPSRMVRNCLCVGLLPFHTDHTSVLSFRLIVMST